MSEEESDMERLLMEEIWKLKDWLEELTERVHGMQKLIDYLAQNVSDEIELMKIDISSHKFFDKHEGG